MREFSLAQFKWIFARFFFLVLMIQIPFELYFVVYNTYKYVFLICICLFIVFFKNDLLRMPINFGFGVNRLNSLNTFVLLSLFAVLTSLVFGGDFDYMNLIQFVFRIFQFYILYILYGYLNINKVYIFLNTLAVTLAFLAIVYFILNFFGMSNPFFTIRFLPHNSVGNEYVFYEFPFGWAPVPIPQNILSFRGYSYFTEPANAAYFFSIFLLYNIYLVDKRLKRYVNIFILFVATLTTLSTAIFVALFSLWLLTLIRKLFRGRFKILIWPFCLILLFVVTPLFLAIRSNVSDQEVLYRRALSVENRSLEFSATIYSIGQYPFGKGIGNIDVDSMLDFESVNMSREFIGPNNLLKYIYYYGWLFVLPLLVFVFPIVNSAFVNYQFFDNISKFYLSSLFVILVFSLSLDVLLTTLSQLVYISFIKVYYK
jgi:hypothetical protein